VPHNAGGSGKGWLIALGAIAALVLLLVLWGVSAYNGLITAREQADTKWADVEAQYQRRADLVPNLVQTVAGFAQQERTVFEQVTDARSRVGQAQINTDDLDDPARVEAYLAAQQQLSGALSRLIAVAENYPELRSSQNFLALQDQLEGTENRIAVARMDYNEAVRAYNLRVQRFPGAIIAGMFGFDRRVFFEAAEGTEQAPVVDSGQFA
jgi:LemA protein